MAAHWSELSPGVRFGLILALVLAAHGVAVIRRGSTALSVVMHAVGTGFCGAGIFLAGQIFHLQAHWPAAFMLWSAGAAAGWWLLRQWPQGVWLAILVPIWLGGEYSERVGFFRGSDAPLWGGLMVVSLCYLTLRVRDDPKLGRALRWLGFAGAIPFAAAAAESGDWRFLDNDAAGWPALWWGLCLAIPLAADALLRRRFEWRLTAFAAGVWLLATTDGRPGPSLLSEFWHGFGAYLVAAAMALLLTWWGVTTRRPERVNLGVLAFGVVVLVFYFSNVMDKFGRSLSLLGLGALFFLLALALGRVRKRLLSEIRERPVGGSG